MQYFHDPGFDNLGPGEQAVTGNADAKHDLAVVVVQPACSGSGAGTGARKFSGSRRWMQEFHTS